MSSFQRWMLGRIVNRIVIQGNHRNRIVEFYSILVSAARKEFTEDNKPTLDGFLEECHQEALENKY